MAPRRADQNRAGPNLVATARRDRLIMSSPIAPTFVKHCGAYQLARTVSFGLLTQSLVIVWYHLAGHHPTVVTDRRARARWNTTKTHPSYQDMLVKLRGVLIAAQYRVDPAPELTPQEKSRTSVWPGPMLPPLPEHETRVQDPKESNAGTRQEHPELPT